jgi:ribA/ribD-fused uncharacterized protein
MSPDDSLKYTTKCHSNRKNLKDKWRKIGSPQTFTQKKFIYKFFYPLNFYKTFKKTNTYGFSTFSSHKVMIKDIGEFQTVEAAFQAYKDIENKEYIKTLQETKSGFFASYLGNKQKPTRYWVDNKIDIMNTILKLKFEQNNEIKNVLLNTGLRQIIYHTSEDDYWGDNGNGTGENNLGKLLTTIRNEYYQKTVF